MVAKPFPWLQILLPVILVAFWSQALEAAGNWDCDRRGGDRQWTCVAKKKGAGSTTDSVEPVKRAETVAEQAPPSEAGAESGPVLSTPRASESSSRHPAERAEPETADGEDEEDEEAESGPRPPRPETPLAASRFVPSGSVSVRRKIEPRAAAAAGAAAPGWSCRPQKESRAWDCDLVGPDPRGMVHPVSAPGEELEDWAQAATITEPDEERFRQLMSMIPADPWVPICTRGKRESDFMKDFLLTPQDRLVRARAPIEIFGDYGEMDDQEVATFIGRAEVKRADQHVRGDFLSMNLNADTVNARGHVFYREKGLAFASDTAFMRMGEDKGVLRNSQFILETLPARGTSRVTHIDSETRSRYETVTYTTCPPGDRDWMLHADQVSIDKETGRGQATRAWLQFKGVPLFYTPYMDFPVDDRRQSGFLTPNIGQSRVGGFNLAIPYYFNLAPNYDLTVTARELTNRGPMVRGDFRWLTEHQRIRMLGEIMPWDAEMKQTRGQGGFDAMGRWTENLFTLVDVNFVSDDLYLNQLGNTLGLVSNRFVQSQAYADYSYQGGSVRLLSDYWQTIDPTLPPDAKPYSRLPSLRASYGAGLGATGLVFQSQGEVVNFEHDVNVKGQRINLRPRIIFPYETPGSFVRPSLALQNTTYALQNQAEGLSSTLNRFAPIVSLDTGLIFERDFSLGKIPFQQTLEPRLFYVYVPKINQDDYPLFDTNYYDFTYAQMFRENRFAGTDRLADMNQVTLGLTSRFIDQESGLERLRASLGKVFFLSDPSVTLVNPYHLDPLGVDLSKNTADAIFRDYNRNFENVIGQLDTMISMNWSTMLEGQVSPDGGRFERGTAAIQYNDHQNHLFNLSYRYRRPTNDVPGTNLDNTDVGFRLPLFKDWRFIGRWQYSLLYNRTLDSFLGVERETCCWRFTVIGRQYLNGANLDREPTTNTAVFIQLELKGLTRLGDQVDRFLYRNLSGYRLPYDDDF